MGAAEGEVTAGEEVAVNIRCSNGSKCTVRASLDSTVSAFKLLVAQKCDVPAQHQRLIYKGRILKDDQTLHSYGMFISAFSFLFFHLTRIGVNSPASKIVKPTMLLP